MEVIGTVEDIKRGGIIYFVWSGKGFHHILLDMDNGEDASVVLLDTTSLPITPWVKGTALNFSRSHRIKATIIDDMLYWTDGLNPPRKVNIEKAIKTGLQQSGGYPFISESAISAIKFPPVSPPKTYFSSNPDIRGNQVRGKDYQFKYRFVYDDHELSICSPISKCIISNDIYNFNGELIGDPYENNVINVVMYTGDVNVTSIQLFARDSNIADWFLISEITKSEFNTNLGSYTYSFDGNESFVGVDQNDVNRQYEYLPDLADTLEFIDGKYMAYGGITEGKDIVDPDVSLVADKLVIEDSEVSNGMEFLTALTGFSYEYNTANGVETNSAYYERIYGLNTGYGPGQYITIQYVLEQGSDTILSGRVIYKTNETDIDPLMLREHIVARINSIGNMTATIGWVSDIAMVFVDYSGAMISAQALFNTGVPEDEIWVFPSYAIANSVDNPVIVNLSMYIGATPSAISSPKSYPAVKSGASHKFGLVYADRYGKKSTVNKNQSCELYVPITPELTNDGTEGTGIAAYINWKISHMPPVWAYSYQWVYAGSSVDWFVQYVLSKRGETVDEEAIEYSPDGNYVLISLFALNKLQVQSDPTVDFTNMGSNLKPYEFKEGDRIRFISKQVDTTDDSKQFPIEYLVDEYLDMEILGYETEIISDVETTTDRIKVKRFNFEEAEVGAGSLIEIYTPKKKVEDEIYYEIGESYPIINPGTLSRSHGGQSGNQGFEVHVGIDPITELETTYIILTDPAEGSFTKLGAYIVTRKFPFSVDREGVGSAPDWNMDNTKLFFAESMQYNDYFESYGLDQGNPNVFDPEARSKKTNTIRRSKAYFEGTKTNGLSTFYYDNYRTLSSKWGRITAMNEIGGTLKVLFERKEASIYIGANNLKQAQQGGQEILVSSDDVFGSVNESETSFGTISPESVIVVNRHLFFFDQNNGCIVRDAANGPVDISSPYKIRAFTNRIVPFLNRAAYKRVVSGYNPKYNEVWFTFYTESPHNVQLSETIVFDADDQGSGFMFVDLADADRKSADAYCSLKNDMYSFRGAQLYKHDEGEYREFYGVKYPLVVEFVSNINPVSRKTYRSLAMNTNVRWAAPLHGDIAIEAGYNLAQPKSLIFPANFNKVEGVWYAAFNKNANHKTGTFSYDSLYAGEDMRGEAMKVRLMTESDEEVVLHSAIVKCQVSEKTY